MKKMRMESPDIISRNIEEIAALFPNVITEIRDESGRIKKGINFELLRQLLMEDAAEGEEAYEFTWVGKKAAIAKACKPIRKTLRPCREESKNWDTTENLYIEGDNLDVLKLLQESHLSKVKVIYIDPPYNTGNDFIYRDDFSKTKAEYDQASGVYDEDENKLFLNSGNSGRFHSDWCSMIYPRLLLARKLLSEDGVIFISIDDNEAETMKAICNEIFWEENFIAQLVWEKKKKGSFLSNTITSMKEYVLVYCKKRASFEGLIGEINRNTETYPCVNASNKREKRVIPAGIESKYKEKDFFLAKGSEISDTTMSLVLHSDLIIKKAVLAKELIVEGNWRYSQEAMTGYAGKKELYITRDLYLRRIVSDTRYKTLKDILPRIGEDPNITYNQEIDLDNLFASGWGSNEDADEELRLLLGTQKLLDYPKPTRLILKLLAAYRNTKDCIVLDFFSGSATTAHAVMKLNAMDGGKRKYIMIQLPEECAPDSEAYKAGYSTIFKLGRQRILLAGEKLSQESAHTAEKLDLGFRVFRLDSTNMKDVYYGASEYDQKMLSMLENNMKEDRSDLDLLYGALLDLGLPLSLPHISEAIEDITVHTVSGGKLIACFARNINDSVIREIADRRPQWVVFRDSSFADSQEKINAEELFRRTAPNTRVRIL